VHSSDTNVQDDGLVVGYSMIFDHLATLVASNDKRERSCSVYLNRSKWERT
jgi:hypothetical protein